MSNLTINGINVNGTNYDIVDTTSGYITGMTILSYGTSTWTDFINAYNSNKVVYCRASTSTTNPASGAQTRLAFMAYVNANPPTTSVEFQYYRSVNGHTDAQQGDQVFVYTLHKTNGWSFSIREAYTKMVAGTNMSSTYSSGTLTLDNALTAGVGIDITSSVITNKFTALDSTNLNNVKYDFYGYSNTSTNYPSGTNADGSLISAFRQDGLRGLQIYSPHASNDVYARNYYASAWQSWERLGANISSSLWTNNSVSSSFTATTIPLDLSPYTLIYIEFRIVASETPRICGV